MSGAQNLTTKFGVQGSELRVEKLCSITIKLLVFYCEIRKGVTSEADITGIIVET